MSGRMNTMHQEITPIPVRPWTLNGISERMIVSLPRGLQRDTHAA